MKDKDKEKNKNRKNKKNKVNKIKNRIKKYILKKLLIIVLPIILILLLVASAVYVMNKKLATFQAGDWGNANFGASQYINNITVDSDGKLESNMTAQELWDKMKKNGCEVDQYLDYPEELARLMKAEIVTQYLDTRENPDEEVDWKYFVENADELQGIVKLKRADSDGNKTTMKYVSPETFQSYIDEYNKTGSEKAKNDALTHFTLKKTSTGTTGPSGPTTGLEATTNTFITKESCPNAYRAYQLLREKGFTDAAACALIGNFFKESGGDGTSDINPGSDGSGRAWYLWMDTTNRFIFLCKEKWKNC